MELALDLKATLHNRPVAWEAAEELVSFSRAHARSAKFYRS